MPPEGDRPWGACVGFLPLAQYRDARDAEAIVWLDIDNTLYSQAETGIPDLMAERIRDYFRTLGLDAREAEELHMHYYKEYGLAIRGLVKHHTIDPMDYDRKCDGSLPLERVLRPDPALHALLARIRYDKVRVYALTNAYKTHASRVLQLLQLDAFVQGIVYCDYTIPDFFYRAAEQAVCAAPHTPAYFVDDSATNLHAAQQLGWHACVLFEEQSDAEAPYLRPDGLLAVSTLQHLPRLWPAVFS